MMTKPEEKLVTFTPAVSFLGYPHGKKDGVEFVADVESEPVPQAFVDLMREKNLVSDKKKNTSQAADK